LTPYVSLADAKKTQSIVQVKGKRVTDGTFDMDKNLFIILNRPQKLCAWGNIKMESFMQKNYW
jgi:hypothetical protein